MLAHGRECAREPALRRHDRGRGGQALRVARQAVLGLLERRRQQVGAADQGVEVHPDLLRPPDRRALARQHRAGGDVGPPMPAAWTWGSIGSRLASTRMRASRWLMVGEGVRQVRAGGRAARRSPAPAGRSPAAGGRSREVGGARHGGISDQQRGRQPERQAADPDLDQAVGDLNDLRGLGPVRNENDRPAALFAMRAPPPGCI